MLPRYIPSSFVAIDRFKVATLARASMERIRSRRLGEINDFLNDEVVRLDWWRWLFFWRRPYTKDEVQSMYEAGEFCHMRQHQWYCVSGANYENSEMVARRLLLATQITNSDTMYLSTADLETINEWGSERAS